MGSNSKNIINWYPFEKDMKALLVGKNLEEIEEFISKSCELVKTITGSLETSQLQDQKFDVILLIDILPEISAKQALETLKPYLSDKGRFLLAIDNKFGLRYFSGHPENILNKKFESLIGYSNEPTKIETYTKASLEKMIHAIGYSTNFYYPLPDYKLPNVIFSDKTMPKYNSIDKYMPYPVEKSETIFNEIDVFREILKTNPEMFPFFTNSFLVEISPKPIETKYRYISFNNIRKPEYRLITKIADEYVEKQVVDEQANNHYEQIKENLKILEENGLNTVDYIENGVIKSKYIEQKYLLNEVLSEALSENKNEEFEKIIQDYIEILKKNTVKIEDINETVFDKYDIEIEDKEILKELHFAPKALWDMTFKNCFYFEGGFHFFDQEWCEENLPIEFILYRSILYTISLRRYCNIEALFDKYDLQKYRPIFEKLDIVLQAKIKDADVWDLYNKNTYFDIDSTKQELENISIRDNAKQLAINNFQEEIKNLRAENEKLNTEKQQLEKQCLSLQSSLNETFYYKLKRKIRNIAKKGE